MTFAELAEWVIEHALFSVRTRRARAAPHRAAIVLQSPNGAGRTQLRRNPAPRRPVGCAASRDLAPPGRARRTRRHRAALFVASLC